MKLGKKNAMTTEDFLSFIKSASHSAKLTYHEEIESDGSYTLWVNELPLSVFAPTREQCTADILDCLKEFAQMYLEQPNECAHNWPGLFVYAVKILTTPDKKLIAGLPYDAGVKAREYIFCMGESSLGIKTVTNFLDPEIFGKLVMPEKFLYHKDKYELLMTDEQIAELDI